MISRVLMVLSVICAFAPTSVAQRLLIEGAETIQGDGETTQVLRVRLANDKPLGEVKLSVSAGSADSGELVDGSWVFTYKAPRVASDLDVTISATGRARRRLMRGRATILVEAPVVAPAIATSKGPFAIAHPEALRPGTAVSIEVKKLSNLPPTVAANLGVVGPLSESEDGKSWIFSYESDIRYPHLVILAVVSADTETFDWVSIPMQAMPSLEIKTEPNSLVTVQVGEEKYGPFVSSAKGRITASMLVNPGFDKALVRGVDQVGNALEEDMPLGAPPYTRVVLACPSFGKNNLLFVTDDHGMPIKAEPITLAPSQGVASTPTLLAPGVYRFSTTGDFGDEQEFSVEASLPGAKQSNTCRRDVPLAVATGFNISLSRPEFAAGTGPIDVIVEAVFDGEGKRANLAPKLVSSTGTLTVPVMLEDNRYASQWTLPDRHEGQGPATLEAASGKATGSTSLPRVAGAVATMELRGPPKSMIADGESAVSIEVAAKDAFENPVSGLQLTAKGRGSIGPFAEDDPGTYRASYRAPHSTERLSESIVVEAGALRETFTFTLRAGPTLRYVSANLGVASNLGRLVGAAFSADIMQSLPLLGRRLSIGAHAGLIYSIGEQPGEMDEQAIDVTARSVPALAKVRLSYTLGPVVATATVGGGILWTELWTESDLIATRPRSSILPSGMAGLGAQIPAGPGLIAADVAYLYANVEEDIALGNPVGLVTSLGYQIGF